MMGYDAWLSNDPREKSAGAEDAYEKWCEENDLDVEDDNWDEFEEAMYDMAEDAQLEAAENRSDR
jgi:hypothetical protein